MYVYICPNAESAAQTHGVADRIATLIQRIEANPYLFSLLFSSRFPCWIRRMRNLRLVADLKFFGQDRVLCLADILLRGSAEYRAFLDNREQWRHHNINVDGVQAWLEKQKLAPPPIQLPIPDSLHGWLDRPSLMQREEKVIYESFLWVNNFRDINTGQWQSFHGIVAQLVGATPSSYTVSSTEFNNIQVCKDPHTGYCVLFSRIFPIDAPQRHIVFLLAAFDSTPTQLQIRQMGYNLRLFGNRVNGEPLSNPITANDIARHARRAYPQYIVYDFESWKIIESDTNTNLALSGEEEELLSQMNFPTFINGRAGSGKSTMLHYAFAYYCELYLQNIEQTFTDNSQQPACPLFLSYSDRLTEKAYDVVKRLLTSHSNYINSDHPLTTAQLDLLSQCFQPFQAFLISCLPTDVVGDRHQYISFYEFKKRYTKSFPHTKYSAEVCWHAIRTYIKGYHFVDEHQDYLSVEEYLDEIPIDHKTISDDDFKEIHHNIWKWYRNLCQNEHLWDDQDLARRVLRGIADGQISSACYAAIFCDEAQDFTRIEFQIILRLSVWSKYLLPNPVNSLPFAFAGDPLQTLNPTGFSWTSFRAGFYENVLIPLDPDHLRNLRDPDKLALHQLQQNYRSPAHVVRFTNFIHLWRRVLFDLKNLEPQEPWWREDHRRPQQGVLNTDISVTDLTKLVNSGAIFLLPCDQGGELEFLRASPILQQVFSTYIENGQIPPTVYTPVGLKGLELSHIVVYCFGEYYAENFGGNSLQSLTDTRNNLHLEYFLNKLYVAVSRSTDYLAIVDTQRGDQLLWEAATQNQLKNWLKRIPLTQLPAEQRESYRQEWADNISFLIRQIIIPGAGQVDFQANAKQWLLSGIEKQDIHNLETAIYYYDKAAMPKEVRYCQAWIVSFQGDLLPAGRAFLELGSFADPDLPSPQEASWHCFWYGRYWQDLSQWIKEYSDAPQAALQPVVNFMLSVAESPEQINSFSKFLNTLNQNQKLRLDSADPVWKTVIDRYRQTITNYLQNQPTASPQNWYLWGNTLQGIANSGFTPKETNLLAARCLYQAGKFQQAINIWEQQKRTNHTEYFISKGEILPDPENIEWFGRAKMFDRILEIWQENHRPIDGNWQAVLSSVRQALRETKQFSKLLELEISTNNWLAAIELCDRQKLNNTERINLVSCMARSLSLTPETVLNLPNSQRRLLTEFVNQTIILPEWKPTEKRILEVCIAIEKLGDFRTTLQMIERFTDDRFTGDRQIPQTARNFARERWLVVKVNQAEFNENRGRIEEGTRRRQERDRQAKKWGINLQNLSVDIPTLPVAAHSPISRQELPEMNSPQLRDEIINSFDELTFSELEQLSHYLQFLQYLRRDD